jgi:hypothetical protein
MLLLKGPLQHIHGPKEKRKIGGGRRSEGNKEREKRR